MLTRWFMPATLPQPPNPIAGDIVTKTEIRGGHPTATHHLAINFAIEAVLKGVESANRRLALSVVAGRPLERPVAFSVNVG